MQHGHYLPLAQEVIEGLTGCSCIKYEQLDPLLLGVGDHLGGDLKALLRTRPDDQCFRRLLQDTNQIVELKQMPHFSPPMGQDAVLEDDNIVCVPFPSNGYFSETKPLYPNGSATKRRFYSAHNASAFPPPSFSPNYI